MKNKILTALIAAAVLALALSLGYFAGYYSVIYRQQPRTLPSGEISVTIDGNTFIYRP